MDDFELELKRDFLTEASTNLDDSEQAFLSLEKNTGDAEILNQIFRLAHNLKGASRAVGFGQVAEFTHLFENLILKLKEGHLAATPGIVNLLLRCNDRVRIMINGLQADLAATFENSELAAELQLAVDGKLEEAGGASAHEAAPEEEIMPNEMGRMVPDDVLNQFDSIDTPAVSEAHASEAQLHAVPTPVAAAPAPAHAGGGSGHPPAAKGEAKSGAADESVRVSLAKIETLNNLVGELVIIQSVLGQYKGDGKDAFYIKNLSQLAKLSKEIHETSMGLRMLPVKQTLMKLQRIVRDTSRTLNKDVEFITIGEETEVDKTVLEQLGDPLVHMVRNSVDHGIEMPEERIAAGKPAQGTVTVHAFHEGNSLVIEITDDGKGINPQALREKAIKKGVIRDNECTTEKEMLMLIFHPGFSTKDQISEVSGRGVGMDVVKTNVEAVSGTINVTTEFGKGSVFRIALPLTMAVIDGLVTKVGDDKYVFPLNQVQETLRLPKEGLQVLTGSGEVMLLRGKPIPVFRLSATLKRTAPGAPKAVDGIIIVTRTSSREYGVMVDDISHQQQIVVKRLGEEVSHRKGFMGSSIMGDGKPALILDLHKLYSNETGAA